MSSFKQKKVESFSDVLVSVMEGRGKNQAYLVDKTGKDKKQISEYVSGKTTPFNNTQQEIADKLGVVLERNEDGTYSLFDPMSEDRPSIEEMIDEYEGRKSAKGFSDTEKDLLLEYLLENAESLAKGLRRLVEMEKKRSQG